MGVLTTILSFIVALCKAVTVGLAFKKEEDANAASEHDTKAIERHEVNRTAIDDAVANGVRDAKAAVDGQGTGANPPPGV